MEDQTAVDPIYKHVYVNFSITSMIGVCVVVVALLVVALSLQMTDVRNDIATVQAQLGRIAQTAEPTSFTQSEVKTAIAGTLAAWSTLTPSK